MRKGILFLVISTLLILISTPPLFVMGREVLIQQKVSNQYKIENIYHPIDMSTDPFHRLFYLQDGSMKAFPEMKREVYVNGSPISDYSEFGFMVYPSGENELTRIISFYHTDIAIVDTFTSTENPEGREKSNVKILIHGTDYAESVPLEIRRDYLDNNRYHGYLGMIKMTKKSTDEEFLMIIQRLFDNPFQIQEKDFKWKTISINEEGEVETDIFTRDQIDDPAYRKDIINKAIVSPYALGYHSNLLQGFPSLFFPLLYPFGSMLLGMILFIIWIIRRKREKKLVE